MKVLFLFGEICSGKSTYDPGTTYHRYTVSSVVKAIMQTQDRALLQDSKHLTEHIANTICEDISHYHNFVFVDEQTTPQYFVIDGIRQHEILNTIEQFLQRNYPSINLEYKWLEVDREERKRRFEARNDIKDTLSFEEAEKRDNELGLSTLFSILKKQNKI